MGDLKEQRVVEKMFLISHLLWFQYGIWDKNEIIGFGRIVEDGYMCMFYDIVVSVENQGKGIGEIIMNNLMNKIVVDNY